MPGEAAAATAPQFVDRAQEFEASELGMWLFLATEVMFFGGLFTAYIIFYYLNPAGFTAAGDHSVLWMGATNTAILLTSSLTMAIAVNAAKEGLKARLVLCLILTMILGAGFLGVKFWEYAKHVQEHMFPGAGFQFAPAGYAQAAEMFFYLYFAMTGLHALHMIGGLLVVSIMTVLAMRGTFTKDYHTPIVLTGLYWHFVDVVWLFLFPMFYLVRRH